MLLDGLKAVEAEKALIDLKISSNHLLLKSKKTSDKFDLLRKDLVKSFQDFGIKNVTITPDFTSIQAIKSSIQKKSVGLKTGRKQAFKNKKVVK